MSTYRKFDGRDIRGAKYALQEVQFYTFFAPLIGADACGIYPALTYLIPESGSNELFEISVRTIAKAAGLVKPGTKPNKKGKILPLYNTASVQRGLAVLIAIGMIERRANLTQNREATFYLAPLDVLMGLGVEVLKARVASVSGGNTVASGVVAGDDVEDIEDSDESGAGSVDLLAAKASGAEDEAEAATGVVEVGVSGGNTEAKVEQIREKERFSAPGDEIGVSGEAIGVSPEAVGVSGEAIGVSPERSLIKAKQSKEFKTPLPPQAGDGEGSGSGELVLADPEVRPGESGWALNAGLAARWVMVKLNVPQRRWEERIETQLRRRMWSTRGESLADVARLMVSRWEIYLADWGAGLLRWGPCGKGKFVNEGMWADQRMWGYLVETRGPGSGIGTYMPEKPEQQDEKKKARAEQVQLWVSDRAKAVAIALGNFGISDRMRLLAAGLEDEMVTDQALQDFEDEMFDEVVRTMELEAVVQLKSMATKLVRANHPYMPPRHHEDVREQYLRKAVFEQRKLPRLSLFYMGQM